MACSPIRNAFLHDDLAERVYCFQPAGFVDKDHPEHVCLLTKSLYGLKQAPRAWFQCFATAGFIATKFDSSLFVYKSGAEAAYLLRYVDDIVLTASSTTLLQQIVEHLRQAFAMKDMGPCTTSSASRSHVMITLLPQSGGLH